MGKEFINPWFCSKQWKIMGVWRQFIRGWTKISLEYFFDCLVAHESHVQKPPGRQHSLCCLQIIVRQIYPVSGLILHEAVFTNIQINPTVTFVHRSFKQVRGILQSFRDPGAWVAKLPRWPRSLRFPGARDEGILSPETNAPKKVARYSTIAGVYPK